MLNNGQTVWTEQFTNEGGPKAEFLFENGLNVNSTPQDWLMAFLPLYDGTSQCPDRESNVCFSLKWAKFTNMKAVQMGAGVLTEFRQPIQVQSHLEMPGILVQPGHIQRT